LTRGRTPLWVFGHMRLDRGKLLDLMPLGRHIVLGKLLTAAPTLGQFQRHDLVTRIWRQQRTLMLGVPPLSAARSLSTHLLALELGVWMLAAGR
jgi:hypothetical protein